MPTNEREVLVQDFGELRIGMIVVLKACPVCGRDHRIFLLSFHPALYGVTDKGQCVGPLAAYVSADVVHHSLPMAIQEGAVRAKHVYRIDDGFNQRQEHFQHRVLETVAAGRAHT